MDMIANVQLIGVRHSYGKKDPNRVFYNLEYRDEGWTRSIGCNEKVYNALKDKKMGADIVVVVRDYPQRIEGAFGLSRLSCVDVK